MNFKDLVKSRLRNIREEDEMEEGGEEASCKTKKCSVCGKEKCTCKTDSSCKTKCACKTDGLAGDTTPEEDKMMEYIKSLQNKKKKSSVCSEGYDADDYNDMSNRLGKYKYGQGIEKDDLEKVGKMVKQNTRDKSVAYRPAPITINGVTYKEPNDKSDIKTMKEKLEPADFAKYKDWWLQWVKYNKSSAVTTSKSPAMPADDHTNGRCGSCKTTMKEDIMSSCNYIVSESCIKKDPKKAEKAKNIKELILSKKVSKKLADKMKTGVRCEEAYRKITIAEQNYEKDVPGALLEYKKAIKEYGYLLED